MQTPVTTPHDSEAERALLGAVLFDNRQLPLVLELLPPPHECKTMPAFFIPANQAVWDAILAQSSRNQAFDVTSTGCELLQAGKLESVGGAQYLGNLCDAVFMPEQAEVYAGIVTRHWQSRRLQRLAGDTAAKAGAGMKPEEIAAIAEADLRKISDVGAKGGFEHIGNRLAQVEHQISLISSGRLERTGTMTGFHGLDSMLMGMRPGNLVILAARPSVGKTATMLNLMANVSLRGQQLPTAAVSLEMGAEELIERMAASEGQIDFKRIRQGRLTKAELGLFGMARDRIKGGQIFFDDSPAATVREIRSRIARLKVRVRDLALVAVDYLQLITPEAGTDRQSRNDQVSAISRGLKQVAKEAGVTILALSQLSRDQDKRQVVGSGQKKPADPPRLSDLRDSGAIEQDADIVIFVHAPWHKDHPEGSMRDLIVSKNRNGECGTVSFDFRGQYQQLVELRRA